MPRLGIPDRHQPHTTGTVKVPVIRTLLMGKNRPPCHRAAIGRGFHGARSRSDDARVFNASGQGPRFRALPVLAQSIDMATKHIQQSAMCKSAPKDAQCSTSCHSHIWSHMVHIHAWGNIACRRLAAGTDEGFETLPPRGAVIPVIPHPLASIYVILPIRFSEPAGSALRYQILLICSVL